MIEAKGLRQFQKYISQTGDIMSRSIADATIKLGQLAETEAKKNVKKNFTGRNDYTLSGRLLNSIYNRWEKDGDKFNVWVGSKGVPYARIHEEGGIIVPVNAKFLWMRLSATLKKGSPFRRLTPTDFYKGAKFPGLTGFYYAQSSSGGRYAMAKTGVWNAAGTPLFRLLKMVKMRRRPYLLPAVKEANSQYQSLLFASIAKFTKLRITE